MSGHSHWAGIKHHKGVNDAKRASIFTKLGRNIIVAAEHGGGNPETNFALRLAIDQAKSMNMPKDNIERAIKRGTGELKEGARLEEIVYEAYGPGNVALLIQTTTDNKNRTVGEVKNILTKGNGKFVPAGSVSFLFERVGLLAFPLEGQDREALELQAIDAGALDFTATRESFIVYTAPETLQKVQNAFAQSGITPTSAELGYRPTQTLTLSPADQSAYERLLETLEDHPDVQTVWDNLN